MPATHESSFLTSAPSLAECPPPGPPEIALIGRSNVGKSSLLNALCRQKNLARVSATPGRTRLLNFFRFNRDGWLVDLPGYGYAKVAQAQRELMQRQAAEYLAQRTSLRLILALLDSRLPPQAIDLEFLTWLRARERPFVLVLTKVDKPKPTVLSANREMLAEAILARVGFLPRMFATSAVKNTGVGELRAFITRVLRGELTVE